MLVFLTLLACIPSSPFHYTRRRCLVAPHAAPTAAEGVFVFLVCGAGIGSQIESNSALPHFISISISSIHSHSSPCVFCPLIGLAAGTRRQLASLPAARGGSCRRRASPTLYNVCVSECHHPPSLNSVFFPWLETHLISRAQALNHHLVGSDKAPYPSYLSCRCCCRLHGARLPSVRPGYVSRTTHRRLLSVCCPRTSCFLPKIILLHRTVPNSLLSSASIPRLLVHGKVPSSWHHAGKAQLPILASKRTLQLLNHSVLTIYRERSRSLPTNMSCKLPSPFPFH